MNKKIWLKKVGIYGKVKGSLMESTHISMYSLQSGKHCHASQVKSIKASQMKWVGR